MENKNWFTPPCFKCKINPSVNQGFCDDCMAHLYDIKIEIREDCKECGGKIVDARYRTYCRAPCRIKYNNRKRKHYNKDWKRKSRAKKVPIDSDI